VNLSLGLLPHPSWSRQPGRPRGRWIDQIRNDTSQTPADLRRQALGRSDMTAHAGYAMMMNSSKFENIDNYSYNNDNNNNNAVYFIADRMQ